MEWTKNLNSDITTALSAFGIDNFLVLGLQEVPGSDERREIYGISTTTKDQKAFIEGLVKLFLEHEELVRLFVFVLQAGDLYRKFEEEKAKIQKEPGEA